MTDTIVLLHGGATGSSSWNPVVRALVSSGASVFAPDMLGYGESPAPTGSYAIAEEVTHLTRLLGLQPRSCRGTIFAVGFGSTFHLVAHSLGALIGLHLRRALGGTLIEGPLNNRDREASDGARLQKQLTGQANHVPRRERPWLTRHS